MRHPTCTPPRRQLLQLAAASLALAAGLSHAQAWPTKAVSLVVPFPPGGTTDVLARAVGERLSLALGQPVIVENKPGAGATLGADYVAKAKADGHTLLIGAVHHTIAGSVYKKLAYDLQRDFAPITTLALVPNVLVVNAQTPVRNLSELVSLLKAQPDRATYGSNGNGTAQHLIGTQFQQLTGTQLSHVPYKGSGPMATDLLGGQILMSFDTITPVLPHIKSGRLRPLAVTTAQRSPALPEVPTLQEAGLKGFDIGTWFGVLAPVATPKDVQARLQAEIVKIVLSPEFGKRMADIGAQPVGHKAEDMARQIKDETDKFAALVKAGKVTVE